MASGIVKKHEIKEIKCLKVSKVRKKLSLSKILHCVDPDDQHGTLLLKKEKTVPAN